jgi:hypothetical protein
MASPVWLEGPERALGDTGKTTIGAPLDFSIPRLDSQAGRPESFSTRPSRSAPNLFQKAMPRRIFEAHHHFWDLSLQMFIDLCSVLMFDLITAASVVSIGQNLNNQTATLEMPHWLFMAPLTLGMALLTLEHALQLRCTLRQGRANDKQTTLA